MPTWLVWTVFPVLALLGIGIGLYVSAQLALIIYTVRPMLRRNRPSGMFERLILQDRVSTDTAYWDELYNSGHRGVAFDFDNCLAAQGQVKMLPEYIKLVIYLLESDWRVAITTKSRKDLRTGLIEDLGTRWASNVEVVQGLPEWSELKRYFLSKPFPTQYRRTAAALDLASQSNQWRIVFVDDKLENVLAAIKHGWRGIWTVPFSPDSKGDVYFLQRPRERIVAKLIGRPCNRSLKASS